MKTVIKINKPEVWTVSDLCQFSFFVLDEDTPETVYFTHKKTVIQNYGEPTERRVWNITENKEVVMSSKQKILRSASISITINLHGV